MITAQLVKELRDKTGAGMLDCKKALEATEGDVAAAVDYLREKGIAKAEKKLIELLQKVYVMLLFQEMKLLFSNSIQKLISFLKMINF